MNAVNSDKSAGFKLGNSAEYKTLVAIDVGLYYK